MTNPGMMMTLATALKSKDNPAIQGYQVRLSPYQVRDNVPMVGIHGVVSRPLPGAQMVVLHHGDPGNAVVIGHNDQRHYLPNLPDGVVGTAHHLGASVLFYDDRIEVQANAKPVKIANAGQVTITTSSKVRIEGDLEVTGEVTAKVDGTAVHLSTHTHSDPQGGSVGTPHG